LLLIAACGGPSQHQILETPAAKQKENLYEPTPATAWDADRYHLIQQFDDMQVTQEAYQQAEVEGGGAAPPPPPPRQPGQAAGSAAPSPRKAPVEQAPKQ
jgi:hypothetical protein